MNPLPVTVQTYSLKAGIQIGDDVTVVIEKRKNEAKSEDRY